jgi:hypothetical protein
MQGIEALERLGATEVEEIKLLLHEEKTSVTKIIYQDVQFDALISHDFVRKVGLSSPGPE